MPKIKILFVSHAGNFYGACRSLYDIISGIERNIFEAYLVSPEEGLLTEKVRNLGIRTFQVSYKNWASIKTFVINFSVNAYGVARLLFLIKKYRIDLVYTNSGGIISGAIAAKLAGKPHIWHIREGVSTHKLAFKVIHRLSCRLIANSEFTRSRFPKAIQNQVKVIYNGFAVDQFSVPSGDEKKITKIKFGVEPDSLLLSIVGNINERKGQKEAVESLALVIKQTSNVRLAFAGDCYDFNRDYIEKIKKVIKREYLEQSVHFLGFHENVEDIYKMTDILLVPSRYEAFGRVIVEAMLFGVPVIGTNVGGIPEIIEHNQTGILIPNRNPIELAQAIQMLIDDVPLFKRISLDARSAAEKRFSVERTCREINQTILEVIKS